MTAGGETYMFDEELAEFGHVLGGQVQGLLRIQLLLDVILVVLLLRSDGVFGHLLFSSNDISSSLHDTVLISANATFRLATISGTRCAYPLLAMVVGRCNVRWASLIFAASAI